MNKRTIAMALGILSILSINSLMPFCFYNMSSIKTVLVKAYLNQNDYESAIMGRGSLFGIFEPARQAMRKKWEQQINDNDNKCWNYNDIKRELKDPNIKQLYFVVTSLDDATVYAKGYADIVAGITFKKDDKGNYIIRQ